jgi:hypothetical protein
MHICPLIVYICLPEFRASVTGSIEFFINSGVKVAEATIINAVTKYIWGHIIIGNTASGTKNIKRYGDVTYGDASSCHHV